MSMPAKRGSAQSWIPGIFNDFFNNDWIVRNNVTAPAINVFECEKGYTVEVAAPEMTKKDFNIHLNADNDLTITMEKNCNCGNEGCECSTDSKEHKCEEGDKCCEERKGRYLRREFSYTKFQQTLILPDDVDTGKIQAKVTDGVLRIEIPKKSPSEHKEVSKQITIE